MKPKKILLLALTAIILTATLLIATPANATLTASTFETGAWRSQTGNDPNLVSFTIRNDGTLTRPKYVLIGTRASGTKFTANAPLDATLRDGRKMYRAYKLWTNPDRTTTEEFVYFVRDGRNLWVTDVVRRTARADVTRRSLFSRVG